MRIQNDLTRFVGLLLVGLVAANRLIGFVCFLHSMIRSLDIHQHVCRENRQLYVMDKNREGENNNRILHRRAAILFGNLISLFLLRNSYLTDTDSY